MKFTPAAALVKSEINTHLEADKIVRKMTFTPGKIAQTKMSFTPGRIAQTKINQPAPSKPKQDYVVISVSETVLEPVLDPYMESLPIADPVEVSAETEIQTISEGEIVSELDDQPVYEASTTISMAY